MMGFFRTKVGVFVCCIALFLMAGTMMVIKHRKRVAAEAATATTEAEATAAAEVKIAQAERIKSDMIAPGVAGADHLPATAAAMTTSTEQMQRKDPYAARNEAGVSVVKRNVAKSSASTRRQGNGEAGGSAAPEASSHEAVRLTPMPRRTPLPVASTKPEPVAAPSFAPGQFSAGGSGGEGEHKKVTVTATDPKMRSAPYGRLVKCELVLTVDSISAETPLVALVTEDQYWNGELIIPAGTEAHGTSTVDRKRDRIISGTRWVLVMPRQGAAANGRELILKAQALDRSDETGAGNSWGITDGSYGLKGAVIKTQNAAEIKLFVSTFLSTAATAFQDTGTTMLGYSAPLPTAKNAALSGTSALINRYSQQLLEEIKANGSYIRVPGGKQFYLYVTETLEPDKAAVAASAGVAHDATIDQTRHRVPVVPSTPER